MRPTKSTFGTQAGQRIAASMLGATPGLRERKKAALRAKISDRMQPGVVYTTFHHAETGANVVTTDYSDWATNCPEYKVTAVQVRRGQTPTRPRGGVSGGWGG